MEKSFKIIGIIICVSSVMAFAEPRLWVVYLPIVFGIGCIVYGMGVIMEHLKTHMKPQ
jgi:hypothetical protein